MSTFQQADSKKTIDEYEWGSGKTLHVQFLFVCLFVCLFAFLLVCLVFCISWTHTIPRVLNLYVETTL